MIALAFKSKKGELKDASPKTGQSSCLIAALLRAVDHPLLDDRSIRGNRRRDRGNWRPIQLLLV